MRAFLSVFLMTKAAEGKTSAAEIAEKLEILESDVLKAWRYWEERDCFAKEAAQMSQPKAIPSERPQYSPAELSCYLKREDVKRLFQSAQQKLGKTLSSGDMATLFSFYDWPNGKSADTRTIAQRAALRELVAKLCKEYEIIEVLGHRDTSPDLDGSGEVEPKEYIKACPCFDVRSEFPNFLRNTVVRP